METMIGPRGCGKTKWAIFLSRNTGARIVVADHHDVAGVLNRAKELGVEIPKPLSLSEFADRDLSFADDDTFIFDEIVYLLRRQLNMIESERIIGVTLTNSNPPR